MSSTAPRLSAQRFKFNSWAQMVYFHAILADYIELDSIKGRSHNSMLHKKRRIVTIRCLKCCDPAQYSRPLPVIHGPKSQGKKMVSHERIAAMVGMRLSRSQVRLFPQAYLDQARRLLRLNHELKPASQDCIRLSNSDESCSLLPDRPRWMQAPSNPIWLGKCRIRAGPEPTGYSGRVWSKKEWFDRSEKASGARFTPRNVLKRKLTNK